MATAEPRFTPDGDLTPARRAELARALMAVPTEPATLASYLASWDPYPPEAFELQTPQRVRWRRRRRAG